MHIYTLYYICIIYKYILNIIYILYYICCIYVYICIFKKIYKYKYIDI